MTSKAVARVEVDRTAQANIASGANTVFTNNKKTAFEGSVTTKGHAVLQGSTTVFVENKPIARESDNVASEGPIIVGSTDVFAG